MSQTDTDRFRLTIAQLDSVTGDLAGNAARARAAWEAGREAGAQLVALPEMFITGYPTGDLVLKPAFAAQAMAEIEALAQHCVGGPHLAIGGPWREDGKLYNAYLVLAEGRIAARIFKHELLHGAQADELRLFEPGPIAGPYAVNGVRVGSPICGDAYWPTVAETLDETGAEILLVPSASPYHRDRMDQRMSHMVSRVVETGLPLVWLNAVGGQDGLVHDGGSFVLNPDPVAKVVQLPVFDEAITHLDFERRPEGWRCLPGDMAPQPEAMEQDYRAMLRGLGDYMRKSGFSQALLGLSGGLDSALVATIAVDALGAGNVRGVMLPSEFTSPESISDATELARRLGIRLENVPIDGARHAVTEALSGVWAGTRPGIAEENIQARLRAVLLMAISNKSGEILLTTSNKSESAVGYSTIYGDMAGSYNPLKDLYKIRVFAISRWRNANHRPWMAGPSGEVIPEHVIAKPPSAELRTDQKDEDSLPPYDVLDPILEGLIEKDLSARDLAEQGFDAATVQRIEHLLLGSEWKRDQAAPGPRLSPRAFGTDRRYPMVNRWPDRPV